MRSILEEKALQFFRGGPGTNKELAFELDVTLSTANVITWKLKSDGLLQVSLVRNRGISGGHGRGQYVYELVKPSQDAA